MARPRRVTTRYYHLPGPKELLPGTTACQARNLQWGSTVGIYLKKTTRKGSTNYYAHPDLARSNIKIFLLTPEHDPEREAYYQQLLTSWPGWEQSYGIISMISLGPSFGPVVITTF